MKRLFLLSLMVAVAVITADLPIWPIDFRWSSAGRLEGYDCVQIVETADPHTWDDNYLCWKRGKDDPGIRWRSWGRISGMRCTRILEIADPHTWSDNYLCVPYGSPYRFSWSSAGPISGKSCLRWYESADPNTWHDNYLCSKVGHYFKNSL